jgi:Putative cyclase
LLILGSQWDGFRHWGLPDSQLFWNGQHQSEIVEGKEKYRNSLHTWAERGIVGRGVLLDYRYLPISFPDDSSWALKNGNKYGPCSAPAHRISTADLDKVAKEQGVELRLGDILFLRTGYTEWYNTSDTEERVRVAKQYPPDIVGIEQTDESVRWLWYCTICQGIR